MYINKSTYCCITVAINSAICFRVADGVSENLARRNQTVHDSYIAWIGDTTRKLLRTCFTNTLSCAYHGAIVQVLIVLNRAVSNIHNVHQYCGLCLCRWPNGRPLHLMQDILSSKPGDDKLDWGFLPESVVVEEMSSDQLTVNWWLLLKTAK